LSFKNDPQRFVFQGVHMILDGDHQRDWRPDEKRESRIVFIGRNLPEEKIRRGFAGCVA
jgi:G3E family GTPase